MVANTQLAIAGDWIQRHRWKQATPVGWQQLTSVHGCALQHCRLGHQEAMQCYVPVQAPAVHAGQGCISAEHMVNHCSDLPECMALPFASCSLTHGSTARRRGSQGRPPPLRSQPTEQLIRELRLASPHELGHWLRCHLWQRLHCGGAMHRSRLIRQPSSEFSHAVVV
jgi:hypothetical protein